MGAIHTDVATMTGNCEALSGMPTAPKQYFSTCVMLIHRLAYVVDIAKRWDKVITLPEAEKGKAAKKPAFGKV